MYDQSSGKSLSSLFIWSGQIVFQTIIKNQCDQIGRFLIFWPQFFLQKYPNYFTAILAIYKNVTFKVKPAVPS